MSSEPHHFRVGGTGRDYDYITYCADCDGAAVDFAGAWIEEQSDVLDVGDSVSVTLEIKPGEAGFCYECGHCNRSA